MERGFALEGQGDREGSPQRKDLAWPGSSDGTFEEVCSKGWRVSLDFLDSAGSDSHSLCRYLARSSLMSDGEVNVL